MVKLDELNRKNKEDFAIYLGDPGKIKKLYEFTNLFDEGEHEA